MANNPKAQVIERRPILHHFWWIKIGAQVNSGKKANAKPSSFS